MDLRLIGFPGNLYDKICEMTSKPHGIFLVTGPTGSGKTTTLYSAMKRINIPDRKIITIEDPVEYQMDGVNQIQANPQIGLTFATGLRHIVRQDPDVIMIGEIRDLETAEIAIRSALTGHLVFSTLHTNDATSAVTRLIDMGVEDYLLASSLVGVLAQLYCALFARHLGLEGSFLFEDGKAVSGGQASLVVKGTQALALTRGEEGTHLFLPPHKNFVPLQVYAWPVAESGLAPSTVS